MKTLDEVEARAAISLENTPGDAPHAEGPWVNFSR